LIVTAFDGVTLLLLTGLFEQLPDATLSAVVFAGSSDWVGIAGLHRL